MESFNDRWGLEHDKSDLLAQLRNRIAGRFSRHSEAISRPDLVLSKYADLLGRPYTHPDALQRLLLDELSNSVSEAFRTDVLGAADARQVARYCQAILTALEDAGEATTLVKSVAEDFDGAAKLTPTVGFRVETQDRRVQVVPVGAEVLDKALVNDPLSWLRDYPKAQEPFRLSLLKLATGESSEHRHAVDNLRLALENLFRAVLGNRKNLENQKQAMMKWLEARNANVDVRRLAHTLLFDFYASYQNNSAKHHSNVLEQDLEFVLYLTGSFMRYVITLDQDDAGLDSI